MHFDKDPNKTWTDYFNELFPKVTTNRLDEDKQKYRRPRAPPQKRKKEKDFAPPPDHDATWCSHVGCLQTMARSTTTCSDSVLISVVMVSSSCSPACLRPLQVPELRRGARRPETRLHGCTSVEPCTLPE